MAASSMTPEQYLRSIGTGEVVHNSGSIFSDHLLQVQQVLEEWGVDKAVSLAGLYHSIYGTEGFQDFQLSFDRRPDVQELIGKRAEFIAYLNCVMDRATLDACLDSGTHPVSARPEVGGHTMMLDDQQFHDLITVHLADWLEQVEREAEKPNVRHGWLKPGDAWGYRRGAYRRMAELLGGPALEMYDKVFAREPQATRGIHQEFIPKLESLAAPNIRAQ